MTNTWKPGDIVALRGIYNGRVWYMQSTRVVQDDINEIVLAVLPGAECSAPEGYKNRKPGGPGRWDRWGDYVRDNWNMQSYLWRAHRVLILLQPETYYSTMLFWNQERNAFVGYYVNFQLPFIRTHFSLDTLDLEIDLDIEPDLSFRWKDLDEYETGIQVGIIRPEWVNAIDSAKPEIFGKLESRQYPFDGSRLDWKPDPAWAPPTLPENWDKI